MHEMVVKRQSDEATPGSDWGVDPWDITLRRIHCNKVQLQPDYCYQDYVLLSTAIHVQHFSRQNQVLEFCWTKTIPVIIF